MNIKKSKGFTLIELLVVVAIIGILASVVLSNLNAARIKGADAAIKASLANARAQAQLFFDASQSFDTVCSDPTSGIGRFVLNAVQKLNVGGTVGDDSQDFVYDAAGLGAGAAVCHDSDIGWAAAVSVKGTAGDAWCVDYSGASKEVSALAAGEVICP
jgi:prepilin-type N-terminal cleavage/methylation domain-containing protein